MRISILATALAVAVSGCASAPAPTQMAAAEPQECRQVTPPGEDAVRELCGTLSQWTEYERRVALLEAGVTCREMLTGSTSNVLKTFCYTREQWAVFEQAQAWESMSQLDGRRGLYGGY